jgi:hypothetical protein
MKALLGTESRKFVFKTVACPLDGNVRRAGQWA